MNEELEQYVPKVHFEKIQIKNLVSNQDYQRNISMKHIQRAAENFDPYQVNPVKVSRRNGINYVFNGQHTIEIIATVSGSRETPVWCMVYDDLSYTDEADIFANQQKYVKNLLPYEIFKANLEAGNKEQVMINDLVKSFKMEIGPTSKPGCICAVGSLEYIYERSGYDVLNRVLRLIIATWEGDQQSLGANMLKGVTKLVEAYEDDLNDTVFIDKLGRVPVREIMRTARELHLGSIGYAEVLLSYYNKKMKNGLNYELLYLSERNRKKNNMINRDETNEGSGSINETKTPDLFSINSEGSI